MRSSRLATRFYFYGFRYIGDYGGGVKVFVHTSSFTPKQQSEACYVSYLSQYPCPKHMGTTPEKAAGVLVPSWYRLI